MPLLKSSLALVTAAVFFMALPASDSFAHTRTKSPAIHHAALAIAKSKTKVVKSKVKKAATHLKHVKAHRKAA